VTTFRPSSTTQLGSVVTAGVAQVNGRVGMRYLGLGVVGAVLVL
jgi:hypothetical protein